MDSMPLYILQASDGVEIPTDSFTVKIPTQRALLFRPDEDSMLLVGIPRRDIVDPFEIGIQDLTMLLSSTVYVVEVEDLQDNGSVLFVTFRLIDYATLNGIAIDNVPDSTPQLVGFYEPITYSIDTEGLNDTMALKKSLVNMSNDGIIVDSVIQELLGVDNLDPDTFLHKVANRLIDGRDKRIEYLEYIGDFSDRIALVLRSCLIRAQRHKRKTNKGTVVKVSNTIKEEKPLTVEEKIFQRLDSDVIPKDIRSRLERDIRKLKQTPDSTLEYSTTLDYLQWVSELPWGVSSKHEIDLKNFVSKLNESHYGLEDVKEHLLEHMAIEVLSKQENGSIMCFVGEPGTGKTTIAHKIAEATGRKFIRIALGGVNDEAEIRGFRRTYVASRPGRIISGLKEAGVMDPVILLDEIDKVGRSAKGGDLTSTFLELLDPEQNRYFTDRYLEFNFDLSKAMFICTANYYQEIPPPLLDRLEIINFRSYTESERYTIAKDYLVTKYHRLYNLDLEFAEDVLKGLAKLPGVRKMEEKIKKLFRMAAVKKLVHDEHPAITKEFAASVLQIPKTTTVGF